MAPRTPPPKDPGDAGDEVLRAVEQAPQVDVVEGRHRGRATDDPILRARRRYQQAIVELERERALVPELIVQLKVKLAELERHTRAVGARETNVAAREREFASGLEEYRNRRQEEIDAELGPVAAQLDDLRRQSRALRADIARERATAVAEHSRLRTECERERDRLLREANEAADAILAKARAIAEQTTAAAQQQTAQMRSDVATREQGVREREHGLDRREIAVEGREHEVADREGRLGELVQQRSAGDVRRYRDAARLIADERKVLIGQLSALREELHNAKQAARVDPAHVDRIERENRELNERLGKLRPEDGATVARLEADLAEARASAVKAVADAKTLGDSLRKHANLHEDLANATEALERARSQRETLRVQADAMRADLDLLRGASGSMAPDDELVAIDDAVQEDVAQGVPRLRQQGQLPDLTQLVDEACRAMATLPDPRFYDEHVVRCFVAGLAASHLHVLEGISGTGKTSLPLAFAKALDLPCTVVEVQAAWRDRLDLVGHYSHLQRRYYSTPFARAVYRSAVKPWTSVPTFIVLDEMNLSYPEQYLADVLSAIERPEELHDIELLQADGKAEGLLEKRRVALGPHVWFIGTANRDETTKTIADKTYDRAHIMSLPDSPKRPEGIERPKRHGTLPAIHLRKLFNDAVAARTADTEWVAARVFDSRIRAQLAKRRLGIGSRLGRQVKAFVPVYTESGGKRLDALDHLFATKVVRRLEAVFDLREEHVDELGETLMAVAGIDKLDQLPATDLALAERRDRAE